MALAIALLCSAGAWADDVPFLREKSSFGGTTVSSLPTFVPNGTTYTLELTGCVAEQEITVPGGSFSYTPTASGTVRFVRNGGDVVYVYEGTTYKGTVSVSTPDAPTYPTGLTTANAGELNLIQNGGFEDITAGTYSSGRYKPTHWTPYKSDKGTPGDGTSVRSGSEITGSYNMLMHADGYYLTQQLASGVMKNFTPYQISFKYKANADGQKGTKYRFDVGSEEFKSDYFKSADSNSSTTSVQTFTKTFITPADIVNQPYVELYSTTNKGSGASQKLDRFDEFILVAANGGGIGITGATGASFLSGSAYAPEGAFGAATSYSLASPYSTSLVTNGTFDLNKNGWNSNTGATNNNTANNQTGAFTGNFYQNWNSSAFTGKMYQSVENIPNGTYKLNICAFVNVVDAEKGQYVYANDNKSYVYTTTPTAYTVYTNVTKGSLEYGLNQSTAVANWMGIDNVSLEYCGPDDVTTAGFEAIYGATTNHLVDGNYANVTGEEKTNLQTAVNASPAETIDGYTTASFNIGYADYIFMSAKPEYDRYVAEKANADRIATSIASEIVAPTTAAGCDAVINSILVAEYNYVSNTGNFNAKQADAYGLAIKDWTFTGTYNGGTTDTKGSNSNEHWSGTTVTYYEQGTNGWTNGNWVANYNKTVTLPAGTYVLRLAARASSNTTATLKATISETVYTEALPSKGSATKGITTDGVASFGDGTFANTTGRGWQWRYLAFTLDAETSVQFDIDAAASPKNEWCSFGDVELYSNVNTSAFETAFSGFTMNQIGFDKDEYAPYNNVEVISAYTKATAIHDGTQAPSTQAELDAITAVLNSPSWTKNDEELNAFYDGNFAIQDEHTTSPTALTGWNNPQGIRQLIKNTTTYPGLSSATGEAAVFAWGNTTMYYGEKDGYTLPLNAYTIYELSFKTCGWSDGDMGYVNVDIKNADSEGLGTVRTVAATKRITAENPWDEFKILFATGDAGNYKLGMWTSKHTVFTDLKLVKAASQTLTLPSAINYAPGTYPTVALDRTFSADKWNTLCVPFAFGQSDFAEVKELSTIAVNGENVSMTLADASTIVAGKPYLVKANNNGDVLSATNVTLSGEGVQASSVTDGGYTVNYVGTYVDAILNAETAGGNAFIVKDNALYHVANTGTVGAYRAYFTVTADTPVKALNFVFDELPTAINAVEAAQNEKAEIYNLAGQRLNKAQKGVNIINGKKVLVK